MWGTRVVWGVSCQPKYISILPIGLSQLSLSLSYHYPPGSTYLYNQVCGSIVCPFLLRTIDSPILYDVFENLPGYTDNHNPHHTPEIRLSQPLSDFRNKDSCCYMITGPMVELTGVELPLYYFVKRCIHFFSPVYDILLPININQSGKTPRRAWVHRGHSGAQVAQPWIHADRTHAL